MAPCCSRSSVAPLRPLPQLKRPEAVAQESTPPHTLAELQLWRPLLGVPDNHFSDGLCARSHPVVSDPIADIEPNIVAHQERTYFVATNNAALGGVPKALAILNHVNDKLLEWQGDSNANSLCGLQQGATATMSRTEGRCAASPLRSVGRLHIQDPFPYNMQDQR